MRHRRPIPTTEQADYAEKVLAFIEQHPEQHDQRMWIGLGWAETTQSFIEAHALGKTRIPVGCGTVGCFAGWTVALDERHPPMHYGREPYWHDPTMGIVMVNESGFDVPIEAWASARLGLHHWCSVQTCTHPDHGTPHPFEGDATMDELRRWVAAIRLGADTGRPALDCYQELLTTSQPL